MSHFSNDKHIDDLRDKLDEEMARKKEIDMLYEQEMGIFEKMRRDNTKFNSYLDSLKTKPIKNTMGEAVACRMTDKGTKVGQPRPHRVIEVPDSMRKGQFLWDLHIWLMKKLKADVPSVIWLAWNNIFDDYFYMEDKDFDKLEKEYLKKV